MNNKGKIVTLTTALLVSVLASFSQVDSLHKDSANRVPHIAIFAPLYLDSAFDASGNYRYDKNFPRFMSSGVDFWEGIQLAIDSLKKEGSKLEIQIFDTKSAKRKPEQVVADTSMQNTDLIIGHVTVNEAALLARTASKLNIPFINVNLPNDASVTGNPNFVILNSTLQTNCTGIYKFLQKNFALSNIIVFRKKGTQEDRLKDNFTEAEKSTAGVPLKMKYVMLEENFTTAQLISHLDSTSTNVCLVGSLDINFGQSLCQQLSTLSTSYTCTLVGMPTWDMIDFEKPQFKGVDVYYSTPFYISSTDKLAMYVQDQYQNTFYVHPSDMVYRGYESLYHFGHLLMTYKRNLNAGLGDKKYKLFSEFDIEPVYNKKTSATDYLENKKLYFVKKVDGVVKAVY